MRISAQSEEAQPRASARYWATLPRSCGCDVIPPGNPPPTSNVAPRAYPSARDELDPPKLSPTIITADSLLAPPKETLLRGCPRQPSESLETLRSCGPRVLLLQGTRAWIQEGGRHVLLRKRAEQSRARATKAAVRATAAAPDTSGRSLWGQGCPRQDPDRSRAEGPISPATACPPCRPPS